MHVLKHSGFRCRPFLINCFDSLARYHKKEVYTCREIRTGSNFYFNTVQQMMSARPGKKPVYLTLQQRYEIILKLENGTPRTQLAKEYNINSSTIHRIELNAAQIRQQAQIQEIQGLRKLQTPLLVELDARLYSWFLQQREIDDSISDQLLQDKATELNKELGGPSSFTASKGLIWRFKRRHGIRLLELRDESACANTAQEFSQNFLQRLEEENINLRNVYSMNETELLWKAVPQKLLDHAGKRKLTGNETNDRVTVILCVNATGTHMLLPILVSKHEGTKIMQFIDDRLPVIFKSHGNASTDRDVFIYWLENDFKSAVRRQQVENGISGKVLLLVDSCRTHILPQGKQRQDGYIEVVYFPTKAMPILQPLGQGIIGKLKRSYRHRMLRKILEFPGVMTDFYKDYNMNNCINILCEAWMDVTQIDIQQSWKKILADRITTEQEAREDQEEDFACVSTIIAITETIRKILGQKLLVIQEEIEEWLISCNKAEDDLDLMNRDHEDDDELCPKKKPHMNQIEADKLFETLDSWSQTQPDFIRIQVQALQESYAYLHK